MDSSVFMNTIFENTYTFAKTETVRNIAQAVINFIIVILVTSILHWCLVNMYISSCIDTNWTGAITNMIRLGSPMCQFVNYSQFELSKNYITIWASAGVAIIAWFASKIMRKGE
jgi:hypothetical protein